MKQVQQICSAFLWKGEASNAKGARATWNELCTPKDEGGLGLRNIELWIRASVLKHPWATANALGLFIGGLGLQIPS